MWRKKQTTSHKTDKTGQKEKLEAIYQKKRTSLKPSNSSIALNAPTGQVANEKKPIKPFSFEPFSFARLTSSARQRLTPSRQKNLTTAEHTSKRAASPKPKLSSKVNSKTEQASNTKLKAQPTITKYTFDLPPLSLPQNPNNKPSNPTDLPIVLSPEHSPLSANALATPHASPSIRAQVAPLSPPNNMGLPTPTTVSPLLNSKPPLNANGLTTVSPSRSLSNSLFIRPRKLVPPEPLVLPPPFAPGIPSPTTLIAVAEVNNTVLASVINPPAPPVPKVHSAPPLVVDTTPLFSQHRELSPVIITPSNKETKESIEYTLIDTNNFPKSNSIHWIGNYEIGGDIPSGITINIQGHLLAENIGNNVNITIENGDLICQNIGEKCVIRANAIDCGEVGWCSKLTSTQEAIRAGNICTGTELTAYTHILAKIVSSSVTLNAQGLKNHSLILHYISCYLITPLATSCMEYLSPTKTSIVTFMKDCEKTDKEQQIMTAELLDIPMQALKKQMEEVSECLQKEKAKRIRKGFIYEQEEEEETFLGEPVEWYLERPIQTKKQGKHEYMLYLWTAMHKLSNNLPQTEIVPKPGKKTKK